MAGERRRRPLALALLPLAGLACGQEAGPPAAAAAPPRAWTVVPRLGLSETYTDNINLANGGRRREWITDLSPGIRIDGAAPRARVHFDYQLRQLLYAENSQYNQVQHALNTAGTVEAVENRLYADFGGSIAQQNISAFGILAPSSASPNANRTETASFQVSPYLRGRLGGGSDYEVRYRRSTVQSRSSQAADVDSAEWSAWLGGRTPLAGLTWSLDSHRQDVDYGGGRGSEAELYRARLFYRLNPELRVYARGGWESNDYRSLRRESGTTHGYGFDWAPGARTFVSASRDRRIFGDSHSLSVSHRLPLAAIGFTSSRDIAVLPDQLTTVGLGSIYDLLFAQLASRIPDPAARAQYVNDFLQLTGIPPDMAVTAGFLTSRISLQNRQNLSLALLGARNTVTATFGRSEHRALNSTAGLADDFSTTASIRQRGFSLDWAHRLSARSSLNVAGSWQRSTGAAGSGLESTQKAVSAGFFTRLGSQANASLSVRRTLFAGPTASYAENAMIAALTLRF